MSLTMERQSGRFAGGLRVGLILVLGLWLQACVHNPARNSTQESAASMVGRADGGDRAALQDGRGRAGLRVEERHEALVRVQRRAVVPREHTDDLQAEGLGH